MSQATCKGITRKNTPCKSTIILPNGYCRWHQTQAAEKGQAVKKQGHTKKSRRSEQIAQNKNNLLGVIVTTAAVLLFIAFLIWLVIQTTNTNLSTSIPVPTPTPTANTGQPAAPVVPTPAGPSTSTDGYGLQPQPYIPHPSLYQETGHTGTDEQKTQTWTLNILDRSTLVYGGYRVDGVNGGVYGAIQGPKIVTITVTDGFISIVTNDWAQQEYCFRVGEAEKYGWAHAYLNPLSDWSCK